MIRLTYQSVRRLGAAFALPALAAIALVAPSTSLHAAEPLPAELEGVEIVEKLGDRVPGDIAFVNHAGETVRTGDWFDGELPTLLTLNYYGCPMLCGLQMNAVLDSLRTLDLLPGRDFHLVTVSFDPREDAALASRKRDSYLAEMNREGANWDFLVGTQENIDALAGSVGYGFRWIEAQNEFAHPAAIMFVSPNGTVTRYLYGLYYDTRDVRMALLEASEGTVGTTLDRLVLSCFRYDPASRSYVPFALGIMRAAGAVTLVLVSVMLVALWRRERSRRPASEAS